MHTSFLGDVAAMKDDGGDAAMWYQQSNDHGSKESKRIYALCKRKQKVQPSGKRKSTEYA
jgi:hypothetical protein